MWIDCGSEHCAQHDWIMNVIHMITIVSTLLVCGAMVYFVIRYRRRGPNDVTSRVAHNTTIEVVWTVIPTAVMFWLFYLGVVQFNDIRTAPPDAMRVDVTGIRWNWSFRYPEFAGAGTNRLYLQAGRDTKLIMRAAKDDVLHSFFVPAFRVKEDVVSPTFATFITFRPHISAEQKALLPKQRHQGQGVDDPARDPCIDLQAKAGVGQCAAYRVFCAEYCGKGHSAMLNWAIVLEPADFQRTLKGFEKNEFDVSAEKGRATYVDNCKSCHSIDGTKVVGPSLKALYGKARRFTDGTSVTADDDYLRKSMLSPNAQIVEGYTPLMPAQSGLKDAQIRSLIEFIKTLK